MSRRSFQQQVRNQTSEISKIFGVLAFLIAFVGCKNATPIIKGFKSGSSESPSASGANPIHAPNVAASVQSATSGGASYNIQLRSREMSLNQSETVNGVNYQFSGRVVIQ